MGEFLGDKPSSRVLRPPGGQTSNIFGGTDELSPGKKSGNKKPTFQSSVFDTEPEPPKPSTTSRAGHLSSNIFATESSSSDTVTGPQKISKTHQSSVFQRPEPLSEDKRKATAPRRDPIAGRGSEGNSSKKPTPVTPADRETEPKNETKENLLSASAKDHSPHLGPVKNTSGVRCAQPPGGKSSISFY